MRKSDPKVKKVATENLDEQVIMLNREKVEAATKLLPPVPKKLKLKLIKKEPKETGTKEVNHEF